MTTLTSWDLALYGGALIVLFLTPGPVWVGLTARTLSGGFQAAWPLALGVVVGDMLWSILAILGVSWAVGVFSGLMTALRWVAAAVFLIMGVLILRQAGSGISRDARLTRPGVWAGFIAGLAVILGNPKAILFYMSVLPGFFDLAVLTTADIAAIVAISAIVPLGGNLVIALFVDRARRMLRSPTALRRTNLIAGGLMIAVGCTILVI